MARFVLQFPAEEIAGLAEVMRAAATRVAFMDHGRMVEVGPPAQVLGSPREERTKLFLSRILR